MRTTSLTVSLLLVAAGCSAAGVEQPVARAAVSMPAASVDATTVAATTSVPSTTTSTPTTSSSTTTTTSTTSTTGSTTTTTSTTSSTTTTLPGPPMTSCRRVAHIGDSTGVWLWEPQYISGDASSTIGARYRAVGVDDVVADNSGGRSIVERIASWQTNALEVATAIRAAGFDGCWVIMIGTNDAANIHAGASTGAEERIQRVLHAIGDQPILWVDAVTNGGRNSYRNSSMQAWNEVLYRVAAERDNVEVLRWSEMVRADWYQGDGIHYTAEGRTWRAAITALELAERFPR